MHIPDLRAIWEMEDSTLQFYALTGATVSLGAILDECLFWMFRDALQKDKSLAEALYYAHRNVGGRRDATDAAIKSVTDDPEILARWANILADLVLLTGGSGARNLVSHNPVSETMVISEIDMEKKAMTAWLTPLVSQRTPGQRPKTETFSTLLAYAGNQLRMFDRLNKLRFDLTQALEARAR
ncbi:MAG: hypothetical protein KKF88_08640 [Alphaproteobacteria bacterium]|nr:hypothetical protein [Alphaproteobacteria bacterium]